MSQSQSGEPLNEQRPRRAGVESRTQSRFHCPDNTVVHLAIRPSFQSFPALVHDVSPDGLGFLLDQPLTSGTVLAMYLKGSRPGASITRMVRVVHSRRHLPVKNAPWIKKKPLFQVLLGYLGGQDRKRPAENSIWLIGCRLNPPLTKEEFDALLGAE
jgi:PilZ domain